MSTAYYTRIERGGLGGVSESVLFAIVRALQLDEAETAHLFDLARAASSGPPRAMRRRPESRVSTHLVRLIDAMHDVPAIALTRLGDPVASNPLARALFPHLFPDGSAPVNHARYLFLDERSQRFYPDWETSARESVSALRLLAGHDPADRVLMALVGELVTRNDDFRVWWGGHTVHTHSAGTKRINHPEVGELTEAYETMMIPGSPSFGMTTYLPAPGSASADALTMLQHCVVDVVDSPAAVPGNVAPS